MRWVVNKMWPRIESGTSYHAQKAKYESDASSRMSSSASHYDGDSTLNDLDAGFFAVDASKIALLNMVLRVG
ncbi:hypothetical protein GGH95_001200 [Coemansia sp. RSA 1836]|nr:hypothetical protein GGF42_000871 [Coemansia sp. RSA 2424]KAJ2583059.1 hypothetical protein GGH95_001200 [Coemansia sp. RSA 1836]